MIKDIDELDKEETEEIDYIKNDCIRKFQFDYDKSLCLVDSHPEAIAKETSEASNNIEYSFAPGEGKVPTNILDEKDWDIKSWPALLPEGKFGLHFKRKVRLTEQQYFCQRILHQDTRFSTSPGYIFAAAAYIEQKQLTSKANIAFMRGRKNTNAEGAAKYELDDAYTTFEGMHS